MNFRKGIAPIISIVIAVVVVAVAVLAWQPWAKKEQTPSTAKQPTTTKQTASTQPDFTGWKTEKEDEFEFKYPGNFTLEHNPSSLPGEVMVKTFLKPYKDSYKRGSALPVPIILLARLNRNVYPGTNFTGAYFTIARSHVSNPQDCFKFYDNLHHDGKKEMSRDRFINNIVWFKGYTDFVNVGGSVQYRIYHALSNENTCYEIVESLSRTAMDQFDPKLGVKPLDENVVWGIFDNILSTFKFSPQNQSTSGPKWEIYRNEKYGYKVEYPKDWYVQKAGQPPYPGPPAGVTFGSIPLKSGHQAIPDNYCPIAILSDYTNNKAEIADLEKKGYKESHIVIDGISAVRLTTNSPTSIPDFVYFSHEGKNFRFTQQRPSFDNRECLSIFNHILSTFKFVQ